VALFFFQHFPDRGELVRNLEISRNGVGEGDK
jgi:hypothetical protein